MEVGQLRRHCYCRHQQNRKLSNTSDAIVEFLDYVYLSLDKKQSTIAVYLDFSKAFDTINYEILMSKLQDNGIRGGMLSWFN